MDFAIVFIVSPKAERIAAFGFDRAVSIWFSEEFMVLFSKILGVQNVRTADGGLSRSAGSRALGSKRQVDRRKRKVDRRRSVRNGVFVSLSGRPDRRRGGDRRRKFSARKGPEFESTLKDPDKKRRGWTA
ncbi:MAG TPA: hypothetical protein DHV36_04825 [Desulfobacteraceae bacterium]|nr:hypothetical protein [Desulfobacteraceae bacterium]